MSAFVRVAVSGPATCVRGDDVRCCVRVSSREYVLQQVPRSDDCAAEGRLTGATDGGRVNRGLVRCDECVQPLAGTVRRLWLRRSLAVVIPDKNVFLRVCVHIIQQRRARLGLSIHYYYNYCYNVCVRPKSIVYFCVFVLYIYIYI